MATRIKELLRHKLFRRVTSLDSAVLGIIAFTSRKQSGTDNCGQIEQKFSGIPAKAKKKVIYIYLRRYYLSPKFSTGMNCSYYVFYLNSSQITEWFSAQMVRALGLRITAPVLTF